MKIMVFALLLVIPAAGNAQMCMGGHSFLKPGSGELNPAVAAGLSIQPMPVALGQFYTGHWQRGILYTAMEIAIAVPGMVILSDRWHHSWGNEQDEWTPNEKREFLYLFSGYVLIKTISAFDAGYSAERHNAKLRVTPGLDGSGNLNLHFSLLF